MHAPAKVIAALVLTAWTTTSGQAQAHEIRQGDYLLRSSTVASERIDPASAAQHAIVPAASRAVLNVLVLRHGGEAGTPIAAEVTASMQNLAGVRRDISLREVKENGRVSYVGSYEFLPREVIDFHITALPAGAEPDGMLKLSYRERMWRY